MESQRVNLVNLNLLNQPVIVPRLDVVVEDIFIAVGIGCGILGATSILTLLSPLLPLFLCKFLTYLNTAGNVLGIFTVVYLIIFARQKRKKEIGQKGVSRTGVLRRYLIYIFGSDYLRGR